MLFDTSYTDKRITKQIDLAVGFAFSFRERIQMGGIGSRRMVICEICTEYREYLNADHYQSTANIELRPKGLIIHFRHKLQAYSWIMPYSQLTIAFDNKLRLESDGKFIVFGKELDIKFIAKLQQQLEKTGS